jgi:hypothetical protein
MKKQTIDFSPLDVTKEKKSFNILVKNIVLKVSQHREINIFTQLSNKFIPVFAAAMFVIIISFFLIMKIEPKTGNIKKKDSIISFKQWSQGEKQTNVWNEIEILRRYDEKISK